MEGCSYFCVESHLWLSLALHGDISVEAQAARLEHAIRYGSRREDPRGAAWNDDLCEAARIGRAASSGVDWTRTEGAALYAAEKAGQYALRRGATSEEAVAAIHAAGAESSGPNLFGALIGRILSEDAATSPIAESEVVGNMVARFGTSEERATLAEISAEVSGLTRGERTWGRMVNEYFLREIQPEPEGRGP